VLDHLDDLVLKPVEGSGGYGILFGPNASGRQLSSARKAIRDDPRGWIAQPVVPLSTVPTKVDDRLVPRHVDLRPFAVNDGEDVFVLPGGLTRVALPKGSLVVNSSQGGGSKDTWVLAAGRSPEAERELGQRGLATIAPANSVAAEHGPELTIGQQQQQQQQGRECVAVLEHGAALTGGEAAPRACTGSAATWNGPTTPRGSSTSPCTSYSRTPRWTPTWPPGPCSPCSGWPLPRTGASTPGR
jgi:hypothetical protein